LGKCTNKGKLFKYFQAEKKTGETFDRNPDNWTMTHHHAAGHQFLSGKHSKV
jgi:hypothetical protein